MAGGQLDRKLSIDADCGYVMCAKTSTVGRWYERVWKAGEPHCYAESSICSNNSKSDWTKKDRKERGREACCLDCSKSGKGGSGNGEENSFW